MVRVAGFDRPCGPGRLAALGCPRQPIHSRSGSNPTLQSTRTGRRPSSCFGPSGGIRPALWGRPPRGSGLPPAAHSLPLGFESRFAKHEDGQTPVLMLWSEWRDSNPRHPAPKAGALPAALHPVVVRRNSLPVFVAVLHVTESLCIIAPLPPPRKAFSD